MKDFSRVEIAFSGELRGNPSGNELVGFPEEIVSLCRGEDNICDAVMQQIEPGPLVIRVTIERAGDKGGVEVG